MSLIALTSTFPASRARLRQSWTVPRTLGSSQKQVRLRRSFNSHSARQNGAKPSPSSSSSTKQSPTPFKADEAPLAIPGPSWLWTPLKPLRYPLGVYNRAQTARPYLTQFVSSLTIYFLGDLSSQMIQSPARTSTNTEAGSAAANIEIENEDGRSKSTAWSHYDPKRSLKAIIIGGTFSIPSYHWFLYLSTLFPGYSHIPRLILQVTFNQVTFAPFFNSYFFAMQALLSYSPTKDSGLDLQGRVQDAWNRVKDTVPTSWWNSCKFWPLVTAFSFTFVQPRSRSVFAGIVAIGWQTYLGLLNQRAAARERLRRVVA